MTLSKGWHYALSTIALSGIAVAGMFSLSSCANKDADHAASATPEARQSELVSMKVTPVEQKVLSRDLDLPGELVAYQDVNLYPKVEGFVKSMFVDRGSAVKKGQVLLTIFAPELDARVREAESKVQSRRAALAEAQSKLSSAKAAVQEAKAKLDADEATHNRLVKAATTPGVVAENDLDVSAKQVEGDQAHMASLAEGVEAAKAMVRSQQDTLAAAQSECQAVMATEDYLVVRAPFTGIITTRNVHEGSLVDPKMNIAMLRIQEIAHLRLVVPVPEVAASHIELGKKIAFTVPAFPGKQFYGTVARPGEALDQHTRTMPVELDVANESLQLEPGMFPNVRWHIERDYPTLFVPSTAVATTTERTFLVRVKDGTSEVVDVERGQPMGNLVEVFGNVHAGDQVAVRASEDMKTGQRVSAKLASAEDLVEKPKASAE